MHQIAVRNTSVARVVGVTAGLSATGAVGGAAVGLAMTLVTGGFHETASVAQMLLTAATAGAVCGAVLFPVGTWTLMRRVPLGRALLWTLIPSSLGAAAALGFVGLTAPIGVLGTTAGFALSAWRLRRDASGPPALSSGA